MDRDLRIRMLLEAGDRVSRPLREIAGGASRATAALKATQDRLKGINAAQNDVASFRKLKAGLGETETAMRAAQARATALGREMGQAGTPTRALARDFAKAKAEAERLTRQHEAEGRELQQLRDRLAAAGVATSGLARHERDLRTQAAAATRELHGQAEEVRRLADRQRRLDTARQNFGAGQDRAAKMAIGGGAAIGAGMATLAPVRNLTMAAIEFESVMADVRKTVDGMEDPKAFRQMGDDIVDLSTRIPMVASGLAAIVAAGGQIKIGALKPGAGVKEMAAARRELLQFAEDSAKVGIAFGLTGDEAGATMAKWRAAFKLGRDGALKLANQVNLVGNNGANTLNVTDIVTRIGPLGAVAGLVSGEIAALGATMDEAGVQSEIAATGIKNMVLSLNRGASATKGQRAAFADIGLEAKDVAKRMHKDATGTILDVMTRLRALPKHQQAGVLTELFGSESVAAIAPVLTGLDKLKGFLKLVNDEKQVSISVEKEYAARYGTTANAMQLAQNNMDALKIVIGNELLPTVVQLSQGLGRGVSALRSFAKENPGVASGVAKLVAAIGMLLVVGGTFGFLGAAFTAAFRPIRFVTDMMGIKTGPALLKFARTLLVPLRYMPMLGRGAIQLAMMIGRAGLMLLANPVVLGIAAIAGAAYLLYANWGAVSAFLGRVWGTIKAGFAGGISGIASLLINFSPVGLLYRGFAALMGWLGVTMPGRLTDVGRNLIRGLINGITGMLGALKSAVVGAASSAANWFKQKLGIRSPSRVFMGFGGFMMQGLARGVDRGAEEPITRVSRLARRIAAAAAASASVPAFVYPVAEATGETLRRRTAPESSRREESPMPDWSRLVRRLAAAAAVSVALPTFASPVVELAGDALRQRIAPEPPRWIDRASKPAGNDQSRRPPMATAPAQYHFHINQAPGQSPQDLAQAIRDEFEAFERRRAASARATYRDDPDGADI